MRIDELQTPALVVEQAALRRNLDRMTAALPGSRLRPHVKAHKCTSLARLQYENGHRGFTCATIREVEVMAGEGLGEDLLLANEVLDARRLGRVVEAGHRVTVAVDSPQTVHAAAAGGVREVVVDVNVGLPRCGCPPEEAGRIADLARREGLSVRGVMGYEGHLMLVQPETDRRAQTRQAMELLVNAAADVGGELVSAGGTGTYDLNIWANEIQAGSYALLDTAYGELGQSFEQALFVRGRVISSSTEWAVVDVGLKSLSLDHGLPRIDGHEIWFCSDEHTTFQAADGRLPEIGSTLQVAPSHVDPTVALHDRIYVVDGDQVIDEWAVDMRGWR